MSSSVAKKITQQLAEKLSKDGECNWKKNEVEILLTTFNSKMDRTKFRDVLHNMFKMTDDVLMDRVFKAFDRDNDSFISQEEMILGFSTFLIGTTEQQIKHCFNVYDLNGDGYISREEMFQMLKNSMIKQPSEEDPDEGIKDLVELALKKMDHDHDSKLSLADFEKSVKEERLLLEAFGPCLPSESTRLAFLEMLQRGNGCH